MPVGSATTDYGKARLTGNGITYGFNAGLFSTPIDNDQFKLTLGASYRSGQTISFDE